MKFKKSNKLFIHIDCDSFFASCEIWADPELKGKYVCVGGEIVTACSYNCKKLGIKTGTPIWEARQILGEGAVFKFGNFHLYKMISEALLKYIEKYTFNVEPFSIDEAFGEITGLPEYNKISVNDYLKKMQKDILNDIGIPVSIGCGNTKLKAKIFSKINKPFGICIGVNRDEIEQIYKSLSFKIIPFVGRKTQEKLKYKCESIYDFMKLGYWYYKKTFGKSVTDIWLELSGVNVFKVGKKEEPKSMSRSRSFNQEITNNKLFLWNQLREHFETTFQDINEKDYEIKTVAILLRDKEFKTYIYDFKFEEYTNNRDYIFQKVGELFEKYYDRNIMYRSMGVIMSDFRSYLPKQLSLFDKKLRGRENNYTLYKTINLLNDKYGSIKISFGKDSINKKSYYKTKCY